MKQISPCRCLVKLAGGGLLAVVLLGCRTLDWSALSEQHAKIQEEAALERAAAAQAHYAAGIIHELGQNPAAAGDEFYQAALADPDDPELLYEVSGRLIAGRHFSRAAKVLEMAVSLPEPNGMVYVRLGFVYGQLGQGRRSLAAHQRAVELLPDFMPARRNLYLALIEAGQPDRAWSALEAAAAYPEADGLYLLNLAELFADYGRRYPEHHERARTSAVAMLDRSTPLVNGVVSLMIADNYFLMGEPDRAAQTYLRFLNGDSGTTMLRDSVRTKLAEIYLRREDRERAEEQLRTIVGENPGNPAAHYFLGAIASQDSRWEEAIHEYQRALELRPDFDPVRQDLALAQIGAQAWDEAMDTLNHLAERQGTNFVVAYLMGMICHEKQDYESAASLLERAAMMARDYDTNRMTASFCFQLGVTQERAGNIGRAAHWFEKTLELSPDHAEAMNYLGYMWAERGEHLERARTLITRALELEPLNDAYLDSMGWVLYQQGDFEGARSFLQQAVAQSESPDATIWDHLGDVYAALNEMDKAREAWAKSLAIESNPKTESKLESLSQP